MSYNFDTIAANYDRMNRLMTLGLDKCWRKRAVRGLHGNVLDVACGTGDMVVCLAERGCTVTGVDISEDMLSIAKRKVSSWSAGVPPALAGKMPALQLGDAEALPFADGEFDAVTCAFGVRNFVHLEKGLGEMLRVLKPGGTMVILELATPDCPIVKPFYNLYTRRIIPWLGSHIAGSREAYTYLPLSIERFPKGDAFLRILNRLEYESVLNHHKLTFGVCRLYTVQKIKQRDRFV